MSAIYISDEEYVEETEDAAPPAEPPTPPGTLTSPGPEEPPDESE